MNNIEMTVSVGLGDLIEAKFVIQFGVGGSLCISTAVANSFCVSRHSFLHESHS